jgi:hypothetical protein
MYCYRVLQSQQSISDLMVYCTISSQMKQCALELLNQGWEVGDIVYALGVSSKSITWWEDNYETFGNVAPPSGLWGHPCILTTLMTDNLHQMISSAAAVQFRTLVRTWTFPNLTNVRFKVRASARTEREVQSVVQTAVHFAEPVWTGSNSPELVQYLTSNLWISWCYGNY